MKNSKDQDNRRGFLGKIFGGAAAVVAGPLIAPSIPEAMAQAKEDGWQIYKPSSAVIEQGLTPIPRVSG